MQEGLHKVNQSHELPGMPLEIDMQLPDLLSGICKLCFDCTPNDHSSTDISSDAHAGLHTAHSYPAVVMARHKQTTNRTESC